MIDAQNGIIPELGNNDPLYRNIDGDTVATILINKDILPPIEWMYDLDYKYYECITLKELLKRKQLPVP